jgi:hypothetical protein
MRKDGGSRSRLEADCLRCARVKDGSEMVARQALDTELDRTRVLTGSQRRIS